MICEAYRGWQRGHQGIELLAGHPPSWGHWTAVHCRLCIADRECPGLRWGIVRECMAWSCALQAVQRRHGVVGYAFMPLQGSALPCSCALQALKLWPGKTGYAIRAFLGSAAAVHYELCLSAALHHNVACVSFYDNWPCSLPHEISSCTLMSTQYIHSCQLNSVTHLYALCKKNALAHMILFIRLLTLLGI